MPDLLSGQTAHSDYYNCSLIALHDATQLPTQLRLVCRRKDLSGIGNWSTGAKQERIGVLRVFCVTSVIARQRLLIAA